MPTDVWRKDGFRRAAAGKIELAQPVDRIADLDPVHKILRLEDRQAGEMGEGGIDEIIVVAHAGNGRIGIIARQYGIDIFARPGLHLLDRLAFIGEALEACWLGLRRRAG